MNRDAPSPLPPPAGGAGGNGPDMLHPVTQTRREATMDDSRAALAPG